MWLENNVIKDKSNEELVNAWIYDKVEWWANRLDPGIENAINDKVEQARQEFLESDAYRNALGKWKDELQRVFNEEFLDKGAYAILDAAKVEEIEAFNNGIRDSLLGLSFDINTEIDEWVREEDTSEITLNKARVPCVLKEVTTTELNDLIDKINDTTFTNKKMIVECMERWWKENIRKIQYLLIGQDYIAEKRTKDANSVLPLYGTDWLMWKETYLALNKYIDAHRLSVASTQEEVPVEETEDETLNETQTVTSTEAGLEETEPIGEVLEREMANATELKEWAAQRFVDYAEQHDKPLSLNNLKSISTADATILAGLEGWQIYLNWLETLSVDTLQAFVNGKCLSVNFKNWLLKRENEKCSITINWVEQTTYDSDLCKKLLWENYNEQAVTNEAPTLEETTAETETPTPTPTEIKQWGDVSTDVQANDEEVEEPVEPEVERDVKLENHMRTTTELIAWEAKNFVDYAKEHGNTLDLSSLEKISKEDAEELVKLEWWQIYLWWLKELDEEVLNTFLGSNCAFIKFPNWEIKNKLIKIDGETWTQYSKVSQELCIKLLWENYKEPEVINETVIPTVSVEPEIQTPTESVSSNSKEVTTKSEPEIVDSNVVPEWTPVVENENNELNKYKDYPTLTQEQAKAIQIYITQNNIENPTVDLWKLNSMDKNVAEILATIPWEIYLNWLNTLDKDVLNTFFAGKCTIVKFPKGQLVRNSNETYIVLGEDPTHYHIENINDDLCVKLLWSDEVENTSWNWNATVTNSPEWSSGMTGNWAREAVSPEMDVSVQYQTSQTMSRENYTRKYENARNEKEAIRLLLWLRWFRNQTDDISVWIQGYDIRRLQMSWEANNLRVLKDSLEYFLELDGEKWQSALFDAFNSIFEQYHQWKRMQWYRENRISFRNMKNHADYVELKDDWTLKDSNDPFVRWYTRLGYLYERYKEWTGWEYFNNVMWLLENYFVRWWISIVDLQEWEWLFTRIFNENNYWVAEWWVDLANLSIDFDDTEWSKDRIWYNSKWEKEFVSMLVDYNLDWRLSLDERWTYMWLELDNMYRSVNIDLQNSELSEQIESGQYVWKNIVNFAIDYFEAIWDSDTVAELSSVNTIDELNAKLKEKKWDEWYKTLISLQTMLKDSPVPISFICKYWNKAQEMFLNELMLDEQFDEMYDAAFEQLVQEWVDPQLKVGLKPMICASYINWWIWGGLWAAYDTDNIWTLSLHLWATHVPWSEDLQYWIIVWWEQKEWFSVWEWNIRLWADVWYGTYWFLALWNASYVSWIVNKERLNAQEADHTTRITIGARAWLVGDWLYASLRWGASYDYIEWIIYKQNELNNYLRESLKEIFDDEKFKTFFTDWKLDTTKWEEIKWFLREKLWEAGEMNQDVVNSAAENIYAGLMYFAAWLEYNGEDEESFNIIKNRIIYQISETYTNAYISDHIDENLNDTLKLTGRSIGPAIFFNGNWAESIAKSIYYTVVWSVQFTRYWNTYMTETSQSRTQYETRLATWIWLDYLEWSIDENWNITQATVDYLNNKLSVIGNYNLDNMKISIQTVDGDESKKVLYIPKELFKWGVNIWLDNELNDYIESDDDWFKVPLNTEIALLTRSRTKATQFDLVIWNYKNSNATSLTFDSEFTWHPLEYTRPNQTETVSGEWEHLSLWNVFDRYSELDAIFTDIETQLSHMDWERRNWNYVAFMNAAADANLDGVLDSSDYDTAFDRLKILLNGKLRNPCFDGLRWKLDDVNISLEEKIMIVDRFKAIFSYNDKLTSRWNLLLQLKGRWDTYKQLRWYDTSVDFPLTSKDYREAVLQQFEETYQGWEWENQFSRRPHPNLIGMTAFYRLWEKEVWRSYMMTEFGWTNVLWDIVEAIADEDIEQTREWFMKNLEKSGLHKEILKSALSEKIKSALGIDEFELWDDNLEKILRWEDIDIWTKKIKINMKYIFYLLWECANESIWVEIWDVEVTSVTVDTPTTGRRPWVYVWNVEAANRTVVQAVSSFNVAGAVWVSGPRWSNSDFDDDSLYDNSEFDENSK